MPSPRASLDVAEDYGQARADELIKNGHGVLAFGYGPGDVLAMEQHTFHRAAANKSSTKALMYLVVVASKEQLAAYIKVDKTMYNGGLI